MLCAPLQSTIFFFFFKVFFKCLLQGIPAASRTHPEEKTIPWLLVLLLPDISPGGITTAALWGQILATFGFSLRFPCSARPFLKLDLSAFLFTDPTAPVWDGEAQPEKSSQAVGTAGKGKDSQGALKKQQSC